MKFNKEPPQPTADPYTRGLRLNVMLKRMYDDLHIEDLEK